MNRYTAAHARQEESSEYSYGDCESVARSAQDIEDALWADKECFGEHVGERFGPLDFRPAGEEKRFDLKLGLVPTGRIVPEIATGLRNIALAQAWRAAAPADRDAIAAQFGKSLLADLAAHLEAKAKDQAELGS